MVPDHAVIKYEVRAPKVSQMQELFNRVVNSAKGAAMMTEEKMRCEVTMAFSDYTPNKTLAAVMDDCLKEVGAPAWTEEEYQLAAQFLRTYSKNTQEDIREELLEYFAEDELDDAMRCPLDGTTHPFRANKKSYVSGSTDVGDVGYAVPTVELNMAAACLGNVGHTWQNTAFSCSTIGMKGMLAAASVIALACVRTMDQPELIEKARRELQAKNGGKYVCPLPDYVTPPIGRY